MRRVQGTAPLPPLSVHGWLRYDVVKRVVADLQPSSALEIGCGQGAFGARLATTTAYVGVEPDKQSFAVAQQRIAPRGGKVLQGMHTVVADGSTYDLVCAFEVLEHIQDDVAALADWTDLVRPGGHLLLSVPAFQDRFGPMDTFAGHFRRYSPEELRDRMTGAGLTDVLLVLYGWPIAYPLEALRNRIDARKLVRAGDAAPEVLTLASGRTFQPGSRLAGTLLSAGTAPFRALQRSRPDKGTGLVAVARKPA
jgi:SAM-dependent methyltransferase